MSTTTGTGGKTEEQRKEAGLEREETQNIFEAIMMNTKETNDILKGIGGDLGSVGAGGDGVGFLEALLGGKIVKDMFGKNKVKTGAKVLGAGAGLATVMKYFKGGGAAAAVAKGTKVQNKAKLVKTKNANFAKKAIGLGKSVAKPLAGFIAVYDLITGFANSDEIMGLDEGTLNNFESSLVGISKAIDTFTFGILDTKKTANFLIDMFTDTAADLDPLREERAIAIAEFEKQKKRKEAGMSTVGYAHLENKIKDLDQRIVALGGVSLMDIVSSDPSNKNLRAGFDLATMGNISKDPEFARLVAEIMKQNQTMFNQVNNVSNSTSNNITQEPPSANSDMQYNNFGIPY